MRRFFRKKMFLFAAAALMTFSAIPANKVLAETDETDNSGSFELFVGEAEDSVDIDGYFYGSSKEKEFLSSPKQVNSDDIKIDTYAYNVKGSKSHMLNFKFKDDSSDYTYVLVKNSEDDFTVTNLYPNSNGYVNITVSEFDLDLTYTVGRYSCDEENEKYVWDACSTNIKFTEKKYSGGYENNYIDGNSERFYGSIYINSADVDTDEIGDIYLFLGKDCVGYSNYTNINEANYIYIPTQLRDSVGVSVYDADEKWISINTSINFVKEVNEGAECTFKAKMADGSFVDLTTAKVSKPKKVKYTSSDQRYVTGDKPVVYVDYVGVEPDDIIVEVYDEDGKTVLATNKGEGLKTRSMSETTTYYELNSTVPIEKLNGKKIKVQSKSGAFEEYIGYYSHGVAVKGAYYNYVDDVVVVLSTGLPEGTVFKAETKNDKDVYVAESKVEKDGTIVFKFTLDGKPVKLPRSYYSIKYKYEAPELSGNGSSSVKVNTIIETEVETKQGMSLESLYYFSDKDVVITVVANDVTINPSEKYILRRVSAGIEEEYELKFVADAVGKYTASVNVGKLDVGTCTVRVFDSKGDYCYGNIYVLDRNNVYSNANYYTYHYGNSGGYGVEARIIESLYPEFNEKLVTVKFTDMVGNPVNVETKEIESSSGYVRAEFIDFPKGFYAIKASFYYDGKPMYNISYPDKEEELNTVVYAKSSYVAYSYTERIKDTKQSAYIGLWASKDSIVKIWEPYSLNCLKSFEMKANETHYFTKEELQGLSYDDGKTVYDYTVEAKDGTGVYGSSLIYLAYFEKNVVKPDKYTGLVEKEEGIYLVIDDVVNYEYNGVYENETTKPCVIQNGKLMSEFSGFYFVPETGLWLCIDKGFVKLEYTGLWNDVNVGWWYVKDGCIDFTYNGLVELNGTWWCVCGGRVCFEYTGLWFDANVGWWYVKDGCIDFSYNGFSFFADQWWCVCGGRVCFEYTGLWCDANVGWWYVKDGVIDFTYNGFSFFADQWWCVYNGSIAFGYTGLWFDANLGWWYVENGAINLGYTGTCGYNDMIFNVVNGMVIFG